MPKKITALDRINAQVDLFYEYRAARRELEKQVEAAKKREDAANADLLKMMQANGTTETQGKLGPVRLETEAKPSITSWPELCAFIHKRKAFELLQKRLTVAAVRERYEVGEDIPGVTVTEEPVLKFSRA